MNKKVFLFSVVLMVSLSSFAQAYRFIYIQADNQQPFYMKYNGKNYSSSSIGYVILPKLTDGNITVQIGFPKNLYPEQTFNLSVDGKDLGYALKNFENQGWGLFNFQTTDVVMNAGASAGEQAAKPTTTTNKSNPFGNMLADAINDSTLNQQRISRDTVAVKMPEPAITDSLSNNTTISQATNNTSVTNDTAFSANTALTKDSANTADSSFKNSIQNPDITKSSESKTSNGTDLTFLDHASKDTIHAFIPSADSAKITEQPQHVEGNAAMADSAKGKVDNPFFNNSNSTTTNTPQPAMLDTAAGTGSKTQTNSSCNKIFSNGDADKLKKKIISLSNQDDVLAAVRKSLRDKCISTEQVRDLGNLFLSDENRYGFYDAVYPFVYDYGNYPQLQNSLIDSYYKTRFKALLR